MKLVIAIIKPFKLDEVREALTTLGVAGMILLPMALLFVKQLHDEGYVGLWK